MKKFFIILICLNITNYIPAYSSEINKIPKPDLPEVKIKTDCDKDAIINRLKCKKSLLGKNENKSGEKKGPFKIEPGKWIEKGAKKITEGMQKIQDTAPK